MLILRKVGTSNKRSEIITASFFFDYLEFTHNSFDLISGELNDFLV